MSVLRFSIRAARKSAHISGKLLRKSLNFTNKVEHKATNSAKIGRASCRERV